MSFESNILQYQLCIKCDNNIAKIGTNYCKKCQVKPINSSRKVVKRDSSRKIYYYKFQNRDTKARMLLNNSESITDYSLCIEPSNLNVRGLQPIENSTLFLVPTWEQFRSLKEFTSCIIQSNQISYPYFILSCYSMIQNLPNFRQFVQNRVNDLPSSTLINNFILPYPLTNALQLLCQESYWDELLVIYFNDFHSLCPLFSIQSFNKKTASPSLLSAMYYCAFRFSIRRSKEVHEYMEKLAMQNIKKIFKKVTIDNLRALVIHTYVAQLDMKLKLTKSLYSHLTRMSYLLGLHIECSKLSPIDRYNRNILYSAIRRLNLKLSGSQNFSPNYLTEYGKENARIYDTIWQLPSPSSPIYFDSQAENQLYSICLTNLSKFGEITTRATYIPSYYTLEANTFNRIWKTKIDKLKVAFGITLHEFEKLKASYSEFEAKVNQFQTHVKIFYYVSAIDLYELLKHKNKNLKAEDITTILEHCHNLYQAIIATKKYNPYYQFSAHIICLHYLNVYSKCSESEKITTKQRLKELIQYIKDKFYFYFSLNYLLLKTGYDSLDDD